MKAGGARVTLAGFAHEKIVADTGLNAAQITLGKRADGQLTKRAVAVVLAIPKLWRLRRLTPLPNVMLARNIEMLFLAYIARKISISSDISIVYECLDIHRMQLGTGWKSRVLRHLEEKLISHSSAVVISSPAFKSNYFNRFNNVPQDVLLLENKLSEVSDFEHVEPVENALKNGPPWKIGWFGTLRCQKSMAALSEFASQTKNQFKIVLRGRPALSVHHDFFGEIEAANNVEFGGSYQNPEDIARIYSDVHFSWLIDFYEEGQNSKWLLPNRLYEGCRFGSVPIALAGTQTASFLEELDIGIVLPDVRQETLTKLLTTISPAHYKALKSKVLAIPKSRWSHSKEDGTAFVQFLSRRAKLADKLGQAAETISESKVEVRP